MAVTVEDGSCIPAANSFVSRAGFIAWAADYRPDLTVPDDEVADGAILRGSLWVSSYPSWNGRMSCGRGLQGLAWPRSGVVDCNGDTIPDDEVPVEVTMATYAASAVELSAPGTLTPSIIPSQQAKRQKVDVIEVEFMTPKDQGVVDGTYDPVEAMRPLLTQVNDLLRCLAAVPGAPNVPWPFVT